MRRASIAYATMVLAIAQAGAVHAANPNVAYSMTACYDATVDHVVVTQTWAATNVDEVAVIIGDGSVGLGDVYAIPRARSGVETSSLGYDQDVSTVADGSLMFHVRVVASGRIDRPAAGWSALAACAG
jgi:hypothetical protein